MKKIVFLVNSVLAISGCATIEDYKEPVNVETSTVTVQDLSLTSDALDSMSTLYFYVYDDAVGCKGRKYVGKKKTWNEKLEFKIKSGEPVTYMAALLVQNYICEMKFTAVPEAGVHYIIHTNYGMNMICSARMYKIGQVKPVPIAVRDGGYDDGCNDNFDSRDKSKFKEVAESRLR